LNEYDKKGDNVWIHKTAKVYEYSTIIGPCIIGKDTEVRPGAFIRGSAIIGDNCVVGNSTEIKNVILFNNVQVPHYNYVGDSILGYKAHMGAGAITSNVKADKLNVIIKDNGKGIEKKDLPYIFERFFRSDTARGTETGGSGIGLSIVKKIIEDSGGRIWAESELGEGTSIHFVLRKYFMESGTKS